MQDFGTFGRHRMGHAASYDSSWAPNVPPRTSLLTRLLLTAPRKVWSSRYIPQRCPAQTLRLIFQDEPGFERRLTRSSWRNLPTGRAGVDRSPGTRYLLKRPIVFRNKSLAGFSGDPWL